MTTATLARKRKVKPKIKAQAIKPCRTCGGKKGPRSFGPDCMTCYAARRQAESLAKAKKRGRVCVGCELRMWIRPRKLCQTCFRTPSIRMRFPPSNRSGFRGHGRGDRELNPIDEPTQFCPGTPGKVAVMTHRAKNNMPLFHEKDAVWDEDENLAARVAGLEDLATGGDWWE